jgi:hypothetical protein
MSESGNYLSAYNFESGLLINFGAVSLEYKKIYHQKLRKEYLKNKALTETI